MLPDRSIPTSAHKPRRYRALSLMNSCVSLKPYGRLAICLPIGDFTSRNFFLIIHHHMHVCAVFVNAQVGVSVEPKRVKYINAASYDWPGTVDVGIVVFD